MYFFWSDVMKYLILTVLMKTYSCYLASYNWSVLVKMAKLSDKDIMIRKEVRDLSESKVRYCIFPWPCHYFAYDRDLEKGQVMIDWSLTFSMNACMF